MPQRPAPETGRAFLVEAGYEEGREPGSRSSPLLSLALFYAFLVSKRAIFVIEDDLGFLALAIGA